MKSELTRLVRFKYRPDNPITYEKFQVQSITGLIYGYQNNYTDSKHGTLLVVWNRARSSAFTTLRPTFCLRKQIIGEIEVLPLHEEIIWRIANNV